MDRSSDTPLVPLACTLVEAGSALHQILSHMEAFAAATGPLPDAPPREAVLRDLLCDVLTPALAHEDERTLVAATRVIGRAVDTIAAELLLVPVEPPLPYGRGRRRRGPAPRACP